MRWRRRLWLGVTGLVGAFVGWLLFRPALEAVPPAYVVGIGVEVYDSDAVGLNPFGHRDARALETLHSLDPAQFPNVAVWESSLKAGQLLAKLRSELTDSKLAGKNLIVFCSLHAIAVPSAGGGDPPLSVCFLGIHATPESIRRGLGADTLIPLKEFLVSLEKSPAEHVVVLIDAARMTPDWRLGVLNTEVAELLKQQIERACRRNPRLVVLCSADAGEQSWTSRIVLNGTGGSIFLDSVLRALRGEADGWTLDSDRAASESEAVRDERISCGELYAYVRNRVNDWVSQHRDGLSQSVWMFPKTIDDFDLARVRRSAVGEDSPRAAPKSETDTNDDQSGETAGEEPAGRTKGSTDSAPASEGSSASQTKAAATERQKGSGENRPSRSETSEMPGGGTGESEPPLESKQSVETTDTDLSSSQPRTSSGNVSAEDKAAPSDRLAFDRLQRLWERRDELRAEGDAAVCAPASWRRLQHCLLRAEQLLRAQDRARAEDELREAEQLLRTVTQLAGEHALSKERRRLLASISLACAERFGSSPDHGTAEASLNDADAKQLRELLAAAEKAGPDDQKPIDSLAEFLREKPRAVLPFQFWFWKKALALRDGGAEEYARLASFLPVAAGSVSGGPPTLPAEIRTLQLVVQTVASEKVSRSPHLGEICRGVIQQRDKLERALAAHAEFYSYAEAEWFQAEQALLAAERWLSVGGGANGQADQWLQKADQWRQRAEQVTRLIRQAFHLRARLLAELPDFAYWAAERAEAQAHRAISLTGALRMLESVPRAEVSGSLTDVTESLAKSSVWERLSAVERTLLQLLLDVRRLNRLLAVGPRKTMDGGDAAGRDRTTDRAKAADARAPANRGQVASGLSPEKPARLDVAALERVVRGISSRLPRLNESMERELAQARHWPRVDALLRLPWVSASDRQKLLERIEYEPSGVASPQYSFGAWHAFWSTLMVELGVKGSEWEPLWSSLQRNAGPNVDRRLACLRYGVAVNEAWSALRGEQVRPDDPFRGELLSRLGTDVRPDADRAYGALVQSRTARLLEARRRLSAAIPVDLQCEPPEINFGVSEKRTTAFTVRVVPTTSQTRPRLRLLFEVAKASVKEAGRANGSIEVPPGSGEVGRSFTLELADDFGDQRRFLTVAALDAETNVPIAIRRVPVVPALDPRLWHVEFRTPEEAAAKVDSEAITRNRFTPEGTWLSLPPNCDVRLLPCLLPPSGVTSSKVDVLVFVRTPDGRTARSPLLEAKGVPLAPSEQPTVLPLQWTSKAKAPKSPADKPNESRSNGQKQIDITGGLVFQIKPEGRPAFRRTVRLRHWNIEKLVDVDEVRVRFPGGRLSVNVPLRRPDDPLLPAKLPLRVHLPADVEAMAAEKVLEAPESVSGQMTQLTAFFPETAVSRLRGRPFEIGLSVAGVPHALRWTVTWGGEGTRIVGDPPSVRILRPRDGIAVKQGEPLSIGVHVDAMALDYADGTIEWTLQCELRSEGLGGARQTVRQQIRAPYDERFRLADVVDGLLTVQSRLRDHAFELSTAGKEGCFELTVRLLSPQGDQVAEDQIEVAVDREDSPPTVSAVVVKGLDETTGEFRLEGRPLRVTVSAEDRQSGIRELAVGLDANADGKLQDSEIAVRVSKARPLRELLVTETVTVPPEKLPKEPAEQDVLARATNGLGVRSKRPARKTVIFTQYGTLLIQAKHWSTIRRPRVIIKRKTEGQIVVEPFDLSSESFLRELKVGDYIVRVERRGGKSREYEVKIVGNKQTELEVDLTELY
ncbi:MAG: hypothetical protein GXP27_11325 [Planctomycetes bacterium]|nr:hypothetical protein [Planctomycetota bacterium]